MSSSGILALFIVCFCTSGRLWATATQMWPDLMKKSREGGLDAIETYGFWNAHEPARRQYDFSGNLDLVRFLKAIQDEGLYAVLRIGPYVCAEWNYGGFPVWLHNMPGIQMRTDNDVFKNEMQNFTTFIVDMVKRENLFASQGGPVILALISTCNGWYCDQYQPRRSNIPKMWTENWTGWYRNWGGKDPHRTTEDLAFDVARFYQLGGTFQNYYMYHGGTNFGRSAGGPYITTSYDYDAPLDEYAASLLKLLLVRWVELLSCVIWEASCTFVSISNVSTIKRRSLGLGSSMELNVFLLARCNLPSNKRNGPGVHFYSR
ncbi:hypothetical protein H0E87_003444 [Populus deltoides]|uniref:beta-galactosidase n=1 Tax=Populus deltoides TaxID=3696 RepID=A0A8T2ZZM2_POPDE|nr:hypothetical protein H0E87_003444 [Populus deltoides]